MSEQQEKHEKKKVTEAVTDQPQEEFISPKGVPSKSETPPKDAAGGAKREE